MIDQLFKLLALLFVFYLVTVMGRGCTAYHEGLDRNHKESWEMPSGQE